MKKTLPVVVLAAMAMVWGAAWGQTATCGSAGSACTQPAASGGGAVGAFGGEKKATARHFQGSVVDEQTNKPIAAFRIVPGVIFGSNDNSQPVQWQRQDSKDFTGGIYDFMPARENVPYYGLRVVLRVEASGYEPATSSTFAIDAKDSSFDFKLKAGKNVEGVVLAVDGKPVANARVVLVGADQYGDIEVAKNAPDVGLVQTTSDARGKFNFNPQSGNYGVVAIHDGGYARIDQDELAKTQTLKLQPWGRIQGVALMGSIILHHTRIQMQQQHGESGIQIQFGDYQTTDKEGKFTFERVPTGEVTVNRMSPNGQPEVCETVNVQAGQTVTVQLGGNGQAVIGRVVKVEGNKAACQGYLMGQPKAAKPSAELLAASKKMQQTMADPDMSPKQKEAWVSQWNSTPEGQAYEKAFNAYQQQMFQSQNRQPRMLTLGADGAFRVEDVAPGDYELFIYQMQTSKDGQSNQITAAVQRQVTVAGHSETPLDLGELKLVGSSGGMANGAVSFEAKTFDGQTFKLADQHGKFVLVDLWATWTPLSDARLAALNDVYKAFGQDKKLVMIGLGAGEAAQVKQFAQEHSMPWLQGCLDEKAAQGIEVLGGGTLPAVVLIGPDGKVIASGLRGSGIKAAVEAALKGQ